MHELHSDMIAFCKSKPADEKYDRGDYATCACGQFAASRGQNFLNAFVHCADPVKSPWAILNRIAWTKPNTFGALAARLEKKLS